MKQAYLLRIRHSKYKLAEPKTLFLRLNEDRNLRGVICQSPTHSFQTSLYKKVNRSSMLRNMRKFQRLLILRQTTPKAPWTLPMPKPPWANASRLQPKTKLRSKTQSNAVAAVAFRAPSAHSFCTRTANRKKMKKNLMNRNTRKISALFSQLRRRYLLSRLRPEHRKPPTEYTWTVAGARCSSPRRRLQTACRQFSSTKRPTTTISPAAHLARVQARQPRRLVTSVQQLPCVHAERHRHSPASRPVPHTQGPPPAEEYPHARVASAGRTGTTRTPSARKPPPSSRKHQRPAGRRRRSSSGRSSGWLGRGRAAGRGRRGL